MEALLSSLPRLFHRRSVPPRSSRRTRPRPLRHLLRPGQDRMQAQRADPSLPRSGPLM